MVIEMTLANVITVAALFIASLWALVKVISGQQERRLSDRFDELGRSMQTIVKAQENNASATQELERELMKWKADLPLQYVRRDDYIRNQTVIEAKLDAMASMLGTAPKRGNLNHAD